MNYTNTSCSTLKYPMITSENKITNTILPYPQKTDFYQEIQKAIPLFAQFDVHTPSIPLGENTLWSDGENIYSSGGGVHLVFNKEDLSWERTFLSKFTDIYGCQVWSDGENIYHTWCGQDFKFNKDTEEWEEKHWLGIDGIAEFRSRFIWTDGENIYMSGNHYQLKLNKDTETWEPVNWIFNTVDTNEICKLGDVVYRQIDNETFLLNGVTWEPKKVGYYKLALSNIYEFQEDYYYIDESLSLKWDVETKTWIENTQQGEVVPTWGEYIWNYGVQLYYSCGSTQLQLKDGVWEAVNWEGIYPTWGNSVHKIGNNIYYLTSTTQYKFDGSAWIENNDIKIGDSLINPLYVWKFKENTYYSPGGNLHYKLNVDDTAWETTTEFGELAFSGNEIWDDGESLYWNAKKILPDNSLEEVKWLGAGFLFASNLWTDGENIYYHDSYKLDKTLGDFEPMSWENAPTISDASYQIWSDGTYIRYRAGSEEKYLVPGETVWHTWEGTKLSEQAPNNCEIWSDGKHLYASEAGVFAPKGTRVYIYGNQGWRSILTFTEEVGPNE